MKERFDGGISFSLAKHLQLLKKTATVVGNGSSEDWV